MSTEYTKGQKLRVRTDYDGCEYITAGKVYDAKVVREGSAFLIGLIDDDEDYVVCLVGDSCSHLDGHDAWEVVS